MWLKRLLGLLPDLLLFEHQFVSNIVFVDIADVLHSLLADVLCRDKFYVAKPLIRIEPFGLRTFAQANNPVRACVVCGKREQRLVRLI